MLPDPVDFFDSLTLILARAGFMFSCEGDLKFCVEFIGCA